MMRVWSCAVVAAVFAAGPAAAQSAGDRLVLPPLPGYVEVPLVKNDNYTVGQWFPAGQSADNWTATLIVKSYTQQGTAPSEFARIPVNAWIPNCTDAGTTQQLANNNLNAYGFASATWQVSCANNSATGKPENVWFKAIQGATIFYLVSWNFRYNLTNDQQEQVVQFMKLAVACDVNATDDHRCPSIADVLPLPAAPQASGSGASPPATAPAAPTATPAKPQ